MRLQKIFCPNVSGLHKPESRQNALKLECSLSTYTSHAVVAKYRGENSVNSLKGDSNKYHSFFMSENIRLKT